MGEPICRTAGSGMKGALEARGDSAALPNDDLREYDGLTVEGGGFIVDEDDDEGVSGAE